MRYCLEVAKCFGLLALVFLSVVMLAVVLGAMTREDDSAGASSSVSVVQPSRRVVEPIAKVD